jgi:hypothetical protein
MVYSNITVIFVVISVVICVLGIAFAGMYYLNKTVDQNDC